MRHARFPSLVILALAVGCSDDAGTDAADTATSTSTGTSDTSGAGSTAADTTGASGIEVSGDAFAFTLPGTPYGHIAGATISIVEHPELSATSDETGHFVFASVPPGVEATFELVADGFPRARTKTFTIPETGPLERVTFQIPDDGLVDTLAAVLSVELDPAACQLVSTITRVGKSIYDAGAHGEAGATISAEPAIDAAHGPIYFNASVIPDPMLTASSEDGGVLYTNVPVGTYVVHASKDGVTFEDVTMKCDAGVLVNASPPFGLQAL